MSDRREYMRLYMQQRRAAEKAARLIEESEAYTEPEEEYTESGGLAIPGGWWLIGVILILAIIAFAVWDSKHGPLPPSRTQDKPEVNQPGSFN